VSAAIQIRRMTTASRRELVTTGSSFRLGMTTLPAGPKRRILAARDSVKRKRRMSVAKPDDE
jgi:hypothetical protein